MTGSSTASRFLHSTVANYLTQLGRVGIAFATRMALARLVAVEGHGQYELALRIVTLAAACRDLGLPYHLMRDERRPYGTVLASTLGLGVAIALLVALLAPLAAPLDPALPAVLRVFAVWIVLDALVVVPRTFFERELRMGRLLAPELGRALATGAVTVGLAAAGLGVWSFVLGDLAASAVFAAWLWARARGHMPLEVRLSWLPGLVRSSIWLFLIWVALQLVTYVDVFIIGVQADATAVGYYSRAYFIAFLVSAILSPRTLTPALVEYRSDPERFVGAFRVATVLLMAFQVTAGYFLFFNAERAVGILLGPDWDAAVPLLRILCFVPFLDPFTRVGGEVLKVRNEDRAWLWTVALNLASLLGFGIWLTRRDGPAGMAWANYLLAGNLLMAWRIARICGPRFRDVVRDLAWTYLLPLPAFAAAAALWPAGSWGRFAASLAAAGLALAGLAAVFRRPFRAFFGARAGPVRPAAPAAP